MNPPDTGNSSQSISSDGSVAVRLRRSREAQRQWAVTPIGERLLIVRRVRESIAARAKEFAEISAGLRDRPLAEVLSAEVLPLLEAHRFVEREAERRLKPQKLRGHGRPVWLSAVESEIQREPRGMVLVIGPGNYPLLLPGVQILQALAAGNSVLFKPAPGTGALAGELRKVWLSAGLPEGLFDVLPESVRCVHDVINSGVDLVVLTGSALAGLEVLKHCAERLTPSVMELSGCDAVIVRADADVSLAAGALAFGLRINGGETCIAPRRVFVMRRVAEHLEAELTRRLVECDVQPVPERYIDRCAKLVTDVERYGGTILAGGMHEGRLVHPLVVSGGPETVRLTDEEIFAPVLVITIVDTDEEAVTLAQQNAYALGASIFSRDETAARSLAERLNAGVVVINDMIVPTADPRIPFGGRGRSGFGVTRGAEGLLTMTVPKVISLTKGRSRPHFEPVGEAEVELFSSYIAAAHGAGWRYRLSAARQLWAGLRAFVRERRKASNNLHHDQ
ncbi:aldehyde dehydrogenase family protein [Verrucomicrobiota bacterium sgz303538]